MLILEAPSVMFYLVKIPLNSVPVKIQVFVNLVDTFLPRVTAQWAE